MSLWHTPRTLADLNAHSGGTLIALIGIVFTEIGDDFLRATMPVDERTWQPMGLLHGGASVVLAETIGSQAASMCLDPAGSTCVGQEINANHVRSVRHGLVTGTARAAHIGGRTHVWTIDIVNDLNQLVCISRLTMAVLRRSAPSFQRVGSHPE
jgi:1,4-dihydroxy-2-naphthoyl-CoA hydrolase